MDRETNKITNNKTDYFNSSYTVWNHMQNNCADITERGEKKENYQNHQT